MRTLAHIRPRWWLLVGAWLTLGAWGPVEEGTTISAKGGGGEYERYNGCTTLGRYRYGGGAAAIRHRFEGSEAYVGGDIGGYSEVRLAEFDYEKNTLDTHKSLGGQYVIVAPRAGLQYSLIGAEFGVADKINKYQFDRFALMGIGRLRPLPRHSLEISFNEKDTMNPGEDSFFGYSATQTMKFGYVYAGPRWRLHAAFVTGEDNNAFRYAAEYRVAVHDWLGAEFQYGGRGRLGAATWSALASYRWSNEKAMPAKWSQVEKSDELVRPFMKRPRAPKPLPLLEPAPWNDGGDSRR
jgi:hypothetical protein